MTELNKQDIALARERQNMAERHAAELAKANQALQTTIDALSEITHPDQIVPRVLEIVAKTFNSTSCAVFKNAPTGRVWLQYWYSDGKIYLPEEMLQLDPDKFALVRMLAAGFEVPDDYLGGPTVNVIGPVILDHVVGTSVAEFDSFALGVGWDVELNIGVASKGIRAFTLCIYRGRAFPFTQQEIILGEALAKQLGLAMETCRLIAEASEVAATREREVAARKQLADLGRINDLLKQSAARLVDIGRLDEYLHSLLRLSLEAVGAAGGGVGLLSPTKTSLRLIAIVSDQESMDGDWKGAAPEVPLTEPSVAEAWRAIESSKGFWWANPHDPGFIQTFRDWHLKRGHTQIAHLPILNGEHVMGFIAFAFRGDTQPNNESLEILRALANQASMAVHLSSLGEQASIAAVTSERERMAREIHDTLAQGFTAILILLKALRKQFSFPPEAIDTLDTLQHVAQDNLIEARRSLWMLRPRALSQGNIVDGLRRLIDSAERAGDMKIELTTDPAIPTIPEKVEDELIRIAQEALQNALRYGEGTQVTIELHAMDGDGVNLSISDDGRGFNTGNVTPGYGLIGMRERAASIGAAMTIISEPGYGTQIIVSWSQSSTSHGLPDANER